MVCEAEVVSCIWESWSCLIACMLIGCGGDRSNCDWAEFVVKFRCAWVLICLCEELVNYGLMELSVMLSSTTNGLKGLAELLWRISSPDASCFMWALDEYLTLLRDNLVKGRVAGVLVLSIGIPDWRVFPLVWVNFLAELVGNLTIFHSSVLETVVLVGLELMGWFIVEISLGLGLVL